MDTPKQLQRVQAPRVPGKQHMAVGATCAPEGWPALISKLSDLCVALQTTLQPFARSRYVIRHAVRMLSAICQLVQIPSYEESGMLQLQHLFGEVIVADGRRIPQTYLRDVQ